MRHDLKCIINHLEEHGNKLLNIDKRSEFSQGRGDGLMRAADILKGVISGDSCAIYNCKCTRKKKNAYDHYELIKQ